MSEFSLRRNRLASLVERVGPGLAGLVGIRNPLSAPELIELARRQTRLSDFGGDGFADALERLLLSCHEEAQLNFVGRLAAHEEVLRLLKNRLYLTAERTSDPSIARAPVLAPTFILGLPRSGTTFLHSLLAQDPASRTPQTWEVMFPSRQEGTIRRRIARTRQSLRALRWLSPEFFRAHQLGAGLPQECVAMMSLSFLSDEFETMFDLPSYARWLGAQDFAPAYEWHRRFLQHLQRGQPARWILKAPAHLNSFAALCQRYPDARIVQTHRAPLAAMKSLSGAMGLLRNIFTNAPLTSQSDEELIGFWAGALTRFAGQRSHGEPGRFCDVWFSELETEPMRAVRRIYRQFGLALSAEAAGRMARFIRLNRRQRQKASNRARRSIAVSMESEQLSESWVK